VAGPETGPERQAPLPALQPGLRLQLPARPAHRPVWPLQRGLRPPPRSSCPAPIPSACALPTGFNGDPEPGRGGQVRRAGRARPPGR
jgi:hypothetical protein